MATLASLIVSVEASTVKLVKGVEDTQRSINSLASTAVTAGKVIASAFVITEVIQAGKSFLDLAGNITDMSQKTGIGVEALQKLKIVAEENGGSLDNVTKSITKMGTNLVGGNTGTVNALKALGLSFTEIRSMKPDDAFIKIGDAIGGVKDPMAQAALATAIFGKAGADNLPMFTGHLKEAGDNAEKMGLILSKDVIKAGDDFGDTLHSLLTAGLALLGKVLGPFLPILQLVADAALKLAGVIGPVLGGAIDMLVALGTKAIVWLAQMGEKLLALVMKIPGMAGVVESLKSGFESLKDGAIHLHDSLVPTKVATEDTAGAMKPLIDLNTAGAEAAKKHAKALEDIRRAQVPLTASQKLGVAQLLAQNIAVSDIAEKYHVSAVAVSNYAEALKRSEDTAKDWLKLHVELADMAHKLQLDVFDKMTAARNAEAQARAADQDNQLKMLTDFHERNYQATLSSTERELRLNELARQQAISSLKGRFDIESDLYKNAEQEINQFYSGQAATIAVAYDEMDQTVTTLGKKIVDNLKDTLLQIPQMLANTLGHGDVGGAVKGTASMVGAAVGGTIGTAVGGKIGAAIGSALGSLAGPLVGQIGKWLGIGATEYEKRMRAAAAETTKLHQELLTSHGGMAQLIIDADLVGINIKAAFNWKDPEAFKNVVSDLDQKTKLLNSAMQEYGFTWEDLGEKARGAKLSQLFDDLYAKTDILRTAGIDYHTILERQAGDYSKLVQAAIRTGTEIPAAMQQTLQDLVEMGKLVDENGVAFTDLSDIHWAKTLTQGFDQVTAAIHELTDALTRGVGGALDDIGRRVVHPRIEPVYGDSGDVGGAATGGVVGFGRVLPFARGGFVPHGTDTVPAMLTPGEIVLNAAQQKNVSDAMGGDVHVYVTIDPESGKVTSQRVERAMRRMAQTGQLRTRAAAGRSY